MANLGKFQTRDFSFWTGITKDNHLYAAYHEEPQKVSEFLTQLTAYRRGGSIVAELEKRPVKEFETDNEYMWDIVTSSRRNIPLVEARTIDGTVIGPNDQAGIGGEPFYVVFPEHHFNIGDVIVGSLNEVYPIRLLGEPRMEGTNAVHKCELMGGITTGMPGKLLQCGERFSKEYAPVSRDLSRGVSDIHFMTPSSIRNEFSVIRIKHKMSGHMINRKIAVGVPVVDNKTGKVTTINKWLHHVDMTLEDEFAEDKGNLIWYGRSNRNANGEYLNFDPSGEVIRMGAGIREMSEVANYYQYPVFSLNILNDAIDAILENLPRSSAPRVITVRTGRWGMKQASEAIGADVSGWKPLFTANADALGVISKTTSEEHPNALRAGYMFTEYVSSMGAIVKFVVDPTFDDPVRNKLRHPDGGTVKSRSYEFDLLGNEDDSNIMLCRAKSQPETRSIVPGIRDPFEGRYNVDNASTDEDASTIHKMWTGGALVKDPTRCYIIESNLMSYVA